MIYIVDVQYFAGSKLAIVEREKESFLLEASRSHVCLLSVTIAAVLVCLQSLRSTNIK